jgi:hypothetical protein
MANAEIGGKPSAEAGVMIGGSAVMQYLLRLAVM